MISMSQVHSIRLLRREGETIAGIARKVGVSRTTVYEKLREGDCSPKMPVRQHKHRMLDDYRAIIEGWLDEDSRNWRK
ncbi:helix-turn-helix domain-containing protein [Olegusella massiliensis]|uniref:helix-turn-helix domain-containing protein n=1 Tax=Olegusella massiliensis TaxID=1776381 RepID=UPI0018DB32E0|nr:helix-turn-helix domain-containing protein [Olegusella massiliensis]